MKWIRYYHGRHMSGVKCPFCDVKRDGVIHREDFYWRIRLSCGHEVGRGMVLPPNELIRLGHANYQTERDPRAVAATNVIIQDAKKQFLASKRKRWVRENLAGNREYM